MAETKLTAHDIRRLITERHDISPKTKGKPEWAVFFELRDGTGWVGGNRYIDAFVLNLWPSKKFWRVAYEIKVSRSDFLHELAQPHKRDFAMSISNEFYFAVAPGVAKPEEIPEGCGLLVVSGSKLKRVKPAVQREVPPLGMEEIAVIARQSCRYDLLTNSLWRYQGTELDEAALKELISHHVDEEFNKRVSDEVVKRLAHATENLRDALGTYVDVFEKAGVTPPDWMVAGAKNIEHIYAGEWQAKKWVRENVRPGPNRKEIAGALAQLASTEGEIRKFERALASMKESVESATAELNRIA